MNNELIAPNSTFSIVVAESKNKRLDTFLSEHFPLYSRTFFKKLIDDGLITINGNRKKPSMVLKDNDTVFVRFPQENNTQPKNIDGIPEVKIVYEHQHFLVIDKPPFLSVHAPSVKSKEPSLVDWLLHTFKEIKGVGAHDRPGIVHRLDKDTSGLLLVSRNNYAHELLSDLFKNRLIKKKYSAVVKGHPPCEGTIDFPISRDPFVRTKMAHKNSSGRAAVTHYKVLEYFSEDSLVEFYPITGRTHQIRVHSSAIGHPIVGDSVYGGGSKYCKRQALHASSLEFTFGNEQFVFNSELPADFKTLLAFLTKT